MDAKGQWGWSPASGITLLKLPYLLIQRESVVVAQGQYGQAVEQALA